MTAGPGQPVDPAKSGSRRAYPLVLVLLAVAAGSTLWALQRTWATASVSEAGLPVQSESVTGTSLYPASAAGAWLALACVVAVVATRGRWRTVAGALVVLAAAMVLIAAIAFPLTSEIELASSSLRSRPNVTVTTSGWWLVVAAAGVVIFGCGLAVLRWGRQWRSLSSRQQGGSAPVLSDWEKLDRGEDPTATSDK